MADRDIVDRLAAMLTRNTLEIDLDYARRRLATRDDAIAEIRALRSALRNCADDLAAEIEARTPVKDYHAPHEYARRMANIERDMAPVLRARELLENASCPRS